ncbi:DUF2279 domain-containing protein [Azospirillum canadense]|uniref:DUF2279 domain-containing protein n=1 Tax=Azospirillum canadense TaxID=403962 RepID=UPI0038739E66
MALGWATWTWVWNSSGPRFQDESWFDRTTVEGGADKRDHIWSGYAISHLFARQYQGGLRLA